MTQVRIVIISICSIILVCLGVFSCSRDRESAKGHRNPRPVREKPVLEEGLGPVAEPAPKSGIGPLTDECKTMLRGFGTRGRTESRTSSASPSERAVTDFVARETRLRVQFPSELNWNRAHDVLVDGKKQIDEVNTRVMREVGTLIQVKRSAGGFKEFSSMADASKYIGSNRNRFINLTVNGNSFQVIVVDKNDSKILKDLTEESACMSVLVLHEVLVSLLK